VFRLKSEAFSFLGEATILMSVLEACFSDSEVGVVVDDFCFWAKRSAAILSEGDR